MTDPFGNQDDEDAAEKPESNIKNGNFLPPEMGMGVGKDKTQDSQEYNTHYQKQTQSFYHISSCSGHQRGDWVVKARAALIDRKWL